MKYRIQQIRIDVAADNFTCGVGGRSQFIRGKLIAAVGKELLCRFTMRYGKLQLRCTAGIHCDLRRSMTGNGKHFTFKSVKQFRKIIIFQCGNFHRFQQLRLQFIWCCIYQPGRVLLPDPVRPSILFLGKHPGTSLHFLCCF